MDHCRNCGTEYGESVRFCQNCGTAVGPDAPPIPPQPAYHENAVWSGVQIFFGGCVLLPLALVLLGLLFFGLIVGLGALVPG